MKINNPTLLKRFFKGELEVGDQSKDFIIEPDYALVFNGKVPYRKEAGSCIVAWRNAKGKYIVNQFYASHPVAPFLGIILDTNPGKAEIDPQRVIDRAHLLLARASQVCQNPCLGDVFHANLENFNSCYEDIEDTDAFEEQIERRAGIYRHFWQGEVKFSLDTLPKNIKAFIMMKKMETMGGVK